MHHRLVVKYHQRPPVEVPVAFGRVFAEYWLPACRQLGLTLIPLFGAVGFRDRAYVLELVSELSRLQDHFASAGGVPDGTREYVRRTTAALIVALVDAHEHWEDVAGVVI